MRTAASQTLSRWDPRDTWSGSNEKDWKDASPGPSSDESDPESGSNSPWSESGSNFNSPLRPSGSISSTESPLGSTHAYPPPGWGGGMASHDAIGWDHASAEANPSSPDHSPLHQTPTEASSGSTSPGHAMPQWLFDDPPPRSAYETPKHSSDSYSYSTGSGSTGSGSTGSDHSYSTGSDSTDWSAVGWPASATGSRTSHDSPPSNSGDRTPTDASASLLSTGHYSPQSPGQTDNHPPPGPPPNPAPSTGPQQSTDGLTPASPESQSPAEFESESFLSKLLKGKIKRRTSGSRTVNAAQRKLQDALDSRAYVPLSSLSRQSSSISSHKHSNFDLPQFDD
ncbi:hypothetical protein F5888DRAFT_1904503 [Russula emetica]|nr:hypothetical protein F5888DRAFT_1904503 [Russula emetica]